MQNWTDIDKKLNETFEKIKQNSEFNNLTNYEKRRIIFEYLCNNLAYDFEMLEKIKFAHKYKTPLRRDARTEFNSVIYTNKGICNAISQYYKLLLEKAGIKAYCVICDDGTEINHQLNLVYNEELDSYSFDDITSVIVKRGTIEDFFDYDLHYANSVNQGNRKLITNTLYVVLTEGYINYVVNRKESLTENLNNLPENIQSAKSSKKKR